MPVQYKKCAGRGYSGAWWDGHGGDEKESARDVGAGWGGKARLCVCKSTGGKSQVALLRPSPLDHHEDPQPQTGSRVLNLTGEAGR